jgi:hypothetical protein
VGVGVGVGDVERLGDVKMVAAGTTLWVGDGWGVGVEVAALPQPAASTATSASAATFKMVTVSEISVTPFGQARAKGPCVTARNPLSIRRAKAKTNARSEARRAGVQHFMTVMTILWRKGLLSRAKDLLDGHAARWYETRVTPGRPPGRHSPADLRMRV